MSAISFCKLVRELSLSESFLEVCCACLPVMLGQCCVRECVCFSKQVLIFLESAGRLRGGGCGVRRIIVICGHLQPMLSLLTQMWNIECPQACKGTTHHKHMRVTVCLCSQGNQLWLNDTHCSVELALMRNKCLIVMLVSLNTVTNLCQIGTSPTSVTYQCHNWVSPINQTVTLNWRSCF